MVAPVPSSGPRGPGDHKAGGSSSAQGAPGSQAQGGPGGARGPPSLSSASASRSYNVAHAWESHVALSEAQVGAVDGLGALCGQRLLPAHLREGGGAQAAEDVDAGPASPLVADSAAEFSGSLENAVLENSSAFHKWHSELEAARSNETERKHALYASAITQHLTTTQTLLHKVDDTLAAFTALQQCHGAVVKHSASLTANCEGLVVQTDKLVEFMDVVNAKLGHFNQWDELNAQFNAMSGSTHTEHLLPLLQKVDEAILYMSAHPQYVDSAPFLARFRQLQSRAIGAVRSHASAGLRAAAAQVTAAAQRGSGSATSPTPPANAAASATPAQRDLANLAEGEETPLLYVRFRAAAEPAFKGLLSEISSRRSQPEYARLLADCQQIYADVRLSLINRLVARRIQGHTRSPLPVLTRNACAYIIQVCKAEYALYQALFQDTDPEGLAKLTDPLCLALYDVLRPALVQLQGLDELCDVADILKHEILQEQLSGQGALLAPVQPTIDRLVADVQERLIFRAQTYIRDEVAQYVPAAGDVDLAPALEALTQQGADPARGGGRAAVAKPGDDPGGDEYATWYPPLQRTLVLLSKLYRTLDARIFGGLAQEAVAACTASIQTASRVAARNVSVLDGQLFLIRYLLILREQITPFKADFAVVEVDLDFTHMRNSLRRIMSGESSLFALSGSNALLGLLGKDGPRVLENQMDSKKDLERQLKVTCEALIMSVTKSVVEPMLSFITKKTAVTAVAGPAGRGKPLREHAFAAPAKLAALVRAVNEAMRTKLPKTVQRMRLYLRRASTLAILLKPIQSNVAEAHGQIAALLAAEYTPEDAAQVPLLPPAHLQALLDAAATDGDVPDLPEFNSQASSTQPESSVGDAAVGVAPAEPVADMAPPESVADDAPVAVAAVAAPSSDVAADVAPDMADDVVQPSATAVGVVAQEAVPPAGTDDPATVDMEAESADDVARVETNAPAADKEA